MTKTLLIDMDAILVNMLPPWLEKYNEATGENVQLSDVKEYNLTKVCTNAETLDAILHEDGFFYDMEPMPHAILAMQVLMEAGYDIVIVTQPPRGTLYKHPTTPDELLKLLDDPEPEFAVRDKRRWMKKYFPGYGLENMIFCHRKDMIRGDLLFDDKPDHLIHWKEANPGGITATLDWGYNRLPEVNASVNFRGSLENGWIDFVDFVHSVFPLK